MTGSKSPHDALFSDTFGQLEHARSLLRALIPADVARHLDLESLELLPDHLVDEKLARLETDRLYRTRLRDSPHEDAFIYVLLEHQSSVDRLMTFRMLKYIVAIWDRWCREHTDTRGLPPVLPVVLSHAPGGWTAAEDVRELITGPESLVASLRRWLPNLRPLVHDLLEWSDAEIDGYQMTALTRLALLLFKHARSDDLRESLPEWAEVFAEVHGSWGREALLRFLLYIFSVNEHATLDDIGWIDEAVGEPQGGLAMTLAEKLRQEGIELGIKKGLEQGLEQGKSDLLLKQIRLKFGEVGESVISTIRGSSSGDLEKMGERILTATTLDEVLRSPRQL